MDAAVSGVVDTSGFLVPVEVKDTPQYGHLIAKLPGFLLLKIVILFCRGH